MESSVCLAIDCIVPVYPALLALFTESYTSLKCILLRRFKVVQSFSSHLIIIIKIYKDITTTCLRFIQYWADLFIIFGLTDL